MTVRAALQRVRILPVVVLREAHQHESIGDALIGAGLSVVEVTLRTSYAWSGLRGLVARGDALVGAGTVVNSEQVRRAHDLGARFVVSPGLAHEVVATALDLGLEVFPGVATASEVMAAAAAGVTTLKYFPAMQSGGVGWLRALASPFPDIDFIPTGGVDQHSAGTLLKMPNVLAVGGSWMLDEQDVSAGDRQHLRTSANAAAAIGLSA